MRGGDRAGGRSDDAGVELGSCCWGGEGDADDACEESVRIESGIDPKNRHGEHTD